MLRKLIITIKETISRICGSVSSQSQLFSFEYWMEFIQIIIIVDWKPEKVVIICITSSSDYVPSKHSYQNFHTCFRENTPFQTENYHLSRTP